MYCKHCGREVDEKAELCPHCGRRLRSSVATFLENSEWTRLKPQREAKSPGLAGFLGFVLGWIPLAGSIGYLYLGQWNWFFLSFVIVAIAYLLTFGVAYVLFPFIFAFHQYQMARELNELLVSRSKPDAVGAPGSEPGGSGPA